MHYRTLVAVILNIVLTLEINSFSNRCFWTKAISIWTSTGDADHAWIVGAYFHYAGGFEPPQVCNFLWSCSLLIICLVVFLKMIKMINSFQNDTFICFPPLYETVHSHQEVNGLSDIKKCFCFICSGS
jgi:hypothetical protein